MCISGTSAHHWHFLFPASWSGTGRVERMIHLHKWGDGNPPSRPVYPASPCDDKNQCLTYTWQMWASNRRTVVQNSNLLVCTCSISIHFEDMSLAPRPAPRSANAIELGFVGLMPPMHVDHKIMSLELKLFSSYTPPSSKFWSFLFKRYRTHTPETLQDGFWNIDSR